MKHTPLALSALALALLTLFAHSEDDTRRVEPIIINGAVPAAPLASSFGGSDSNALFKGTSGFAAWSAGGVASLPVLRGLADDRIKVLIDGAEATSACGNHMNPPLSYADPTQIRSAKVIAGISPVSMGGDAIGGVVSVETLAPVFAQRGLTTSQTIIGLAHHSVDHGHSETIHTSLANDHVSLSYAGSHHEASSYKDGAGNKVLDTLFESTNQQLVLGVRDDNFTYTIRAGDQHIPYQGFANEYMDMSDNSSRFVQANMVGKFAWGTLDIRADGRNTFHEMGFPSNERMGMMPMNTHGSDAGYQIKAELPAYEGTLRLGTELHRTHLDDYWPGMPMSMMMGPDTYENINDGSRNRTALYGEWEGKTGAARSLIGVRFESVDSETGTVHGYNCGMMCAGDVKSATAFNSADRHKRDSNVDLTAMTTLTLNDSHSLELGVARKTRSPNLYERYTWGRGQMAMMMTGWFGDGNGYAGNLNLKPEVANTLNASLIHSASNSDLMIRISPFYTRIKDAIDVDVVGTFNPYGKKNATRALLQFANHDATLYGVNLAASGTLANQSAMGTVGFDLRIDLTRGKRDDSGDLYHIMPANMRLAITQTAGDWHNHVEWQLVAQKDHVDARRFEDKTAGYGLLNVGTEYAASKDTTLIAGVRNLLDRNYALPLGGSNLAGLKMNPAEGLNSLRGQGRSIDLGLRIRF
ncbi:TonB-dependent receptor [Burkholderiaceae bacterium DAT-1]|nr:TonB-dependent receptor [Burkholderiaceae bacterium DAT-1]